MTTKPITQNVSRFVSPTRDVVSITHRDMWGGRISIRYAQTPSSRGKKHTKWVVTRITAEGHYAELSRLGICRSAFVNVHRSNISAYLKMFSGL